MKRRQLAEMRTTIGNRYKSDPTYRTKLRQPAASLNIDELATFTNGLEAMNRTDRLLEMYETNRDDWGVDGELYGFYQRRFIRKELHKLQGKIIHVVTERTAEQSMLHKHVRGLRESKMFLESLNKRWKQLDDTVKKYNDEATRLEGLGVRDIPRKLSSKSLKRDGLRNEEIWDLDRMQSRADWALHEYVREGIDSHFRLMRVEEERVQLQLHYGRMRLWLTRHTNIILLYLDASPQDTLTRKSFIRLLLHRLRGVASLISMKWVPVPPLERNDLESSYFRSYDR